MHNPAKLIATNSTISGAGADVRDTIEVTWDDPGSGVKRTDIQYRKNGDTDWITSAPARINDTLYIILDVLPNTPYDVRARHVSQTNVEGDWYMDAETSSGNGIIDFDSIGGDTKPSDYAGIDTIVNHGGSLIFNSDFTMVASDGRPAGVKAVYGSGDPTNISYLNADRDVLKLHSATDTTISAGFPAFRLVPGVTYSGVIRIKSSANVASGFYLDIYEIDSELPSGITHIAPNPGGSEPGVVLYDSGVQAIINQPLTTSYQEFSFTYTPTASSKWCSPIIANWIGGGLAEFHIDSFILNDQATENHGDLSHKDTVDTPDIVNHAVTNVVSANAELASLIALTLNTIVPVPITTNGGDVYLAATAQGSTGSSPTQTTYGLYRDATLIRPMVLWTNRGDVVSLSYVDSPPAGSYVYSLKAYPATSTNAAKSNIVAMELKK